MDRHRCKLCLKSFSNGRALGGHMRYHMLNLPIPLKSEEEEEEDEEEEEHDLNVHLSEDTASSSSEEEEGDEKEILYGLRENPKRSIKLVDREFSFSVEASASASASSFVLQDRESETESSKNPTRRRSKRTRKLLEQRFGEMKKLKFRSDFSKMTTTEPWPPAAAYPEQPASSISETTTEEDVAFCLMMLSRDNKWMKNKKEKYEDEEEKSEESDESKSFKIRIRGKYKCETCNRVFKSYQALGGHRASHKKLKLVNQNHEAAEFETENNTNNAVTSTSNPAKKIHECPYCLRVFSSGQALGGHKRSHLIGVASNPVRISTQIEDNLNLIDLNLPAPIDEDDASQIELSAVSDAEFVNHIKAKR